MKLAEPDEKIEDDKSKDEERLKSFFRSNDERFKNLINEHRQFQLNQKRALFNRALRQTLSHNLVYPGLQACKTYEPSSPVEQEGKKSLDSTLKVPESHVRSVKNRNLPTPRYYVPKRLPKRPSNTTKSFDRNSLIIFTSHGNHSASIQAQAFDNSFGIRALERRIEEEMRIQSERKKFPDGFQRSVSLDVPDSAHKSSMQVSNISSSLSFTNGSKPHISYIPKAKKVNGFSSTSTVVEFTNKRVVENKNLGPTFSRPPLKRQSNVGLEKKADETDSTEENTEESFLWESNCDFSCKPDDFQDSTTKVTLSCRQPLVSFNDIVDYLSISTDDNGSFEEPRFEELHAFLCKCKYGLEESDGDKVMKPHTNLYEEIEDAEEFKGLNANSSDPDFSSNDNIKSNNQSEVWGSCARRQRLKDTSWRRLCSDSQDFEICKATSASVKDGKVCSDIISEERGEVGDGRSQVQRDRPGEVKRPKKSLCLEKILSQHSLEENGPTPNENESGSLSLSLGSSSRRLTSESSPMSSISPLQSCLSLSSPNPPSSSSPCSLFSPVSSSTSSSSNCPGTCSSDCSCDTASKSTSSCSGQTSSYQKDAYPHELDQIRNRTKSRRVRRVPFNLARISTDSVDEVFSPHTNNGVSRTNGKDQCAFKENGINAFGKKFPPSRRSKHRRASVKLGSHKITIESPTSSEGDNTSRTDPDEYLTSFKSSVSDSDGDRHKISVASSCEWLTDNEGYYEDSLNVEKLEDKYKLERVNQEKQLKMSKSFNEGERSHEVKVSRTSSLKKFNSEGNICDISCSDRKKSKMTIVELFETEKNYTSNLLTILEVFSEPLKDMGLLTKKAHSILFPHQLIRLVYKHSMFLGRLEERLNNWHHVEKIGDLFCEFKEETNGGLFKVYLSYITHFPILFEKLSKISTANERFRQYIQKCRQEEPACQRLSLLSLLYNPIQRLPQYLMLLKTYSKHLDPLHADCDPVDSATSSLQTLLFMANKLCNFRKDGPGSIKLPTSTTLHLEEQTQKRRCSDSVMSTVSSDFESSKNQPIDPRKPVSHKKLSTLLNVLTFSSIIKKRKKDRLRDRNNDDVGNSCTSYHTHSYTD
ncbi:hypothetical protein ACHWQZ_G000092 [Mnemiopsis leidyi]